MKENDKLLTILHTNDTHSRIENFAKVHSIIEKVKFNNEKSNITTFVVDAGDVISGSGFDPQVEDSIEANLLNQVGYDAMVLGNHEFDHGSSGLKRFLKGIDFPVLTTNLNLDDDKILTQNEKDKLIEYNIHQITKEQRIILLGATALETKTFASPSIETKFEEPLDAIKRTLKEIQTLDNDIVVLLSHCGLSEDIRVAEEYDGIDVIIGGHTHDCLSKPLEVLNKVNDKPTLIMQAGSNGNYIGELTLGLNNQNLIYEYILHDITKHDEENKTTKQLINNVKAEKRIEDEKLVGNTAVYLNGKRKYIQHQETNLGNLVADGYFTGAMRRGYKPDLAIINGGGIRRSLEIGSILHKDVVEVMPFGTHLTIVEICGEDILQSFKQGLFLQVSNLKVEINKDNNNIELFVKKDGKYKPIQLEEMYVVATNNYVATGKDNYVGFKNGKIIATNIESDVNVFEEHLKSLKQPIEAKVEGRIIIK